MEKLLGLGAWAHSFHQIELPSRASGQCLQRVSGFTVTGASEALDTLVAGNVRTYADAAPYVTWQVDRLSRCVRSHSAANERVHRLGALAASADAVTKRLEELQRSPNCRNSSAKGAICAW